MKGGEGGGSTGFKSLPLLAIKKSKT